MGTPENTDTRSLHEEESAPGQGQDAVEVVEPVAPVPNGGFQAWLSVLAGFCVFVNSWYGNQYSHRGPWAQANEQGTACVVWRIPREALPL